MTKDATPKASKRWRCLATGCNPILDEAAALTHTQDTSHRTAKWPVRSAAGIKAAKHRNRTGYYDKYNVGAKSAAARGIGAHGRPRRGGAPETDTRSIVDQIHDEMHPFEDEAFG